MSDVQRYTYSDIMRAHVNGEGLPAYMVDADAYDKLVETVCKLRDKLLEITKGCSSCNGTGVVTVRGFGALGKAFERTEECSDCADLREVLE
jgi:hypothetical protein